MGGGIHDAVPPADKGEYSPTATAAYRAQGTNNDELLQSRKWKLRVSVQPQTPG